MMWMSVSVEGSVGVSRVKKTLDQVTAFEDFHAVVYAPMLTAPL
jgi:hypothetical protein